MPSTLRHRITRWSAGAWTSGEAGRATTWLIELPLLTIALVVLCAAFVVFGRIWPGGHTIGEAEETSSRLWSGLWKREDADRFRNRR